MIRAIIIDDEESALENMRMLLAQHCPEIEIVGEASGVVEGVALIGKVECDILFTDIEMPDGTGFDLLDMVENKEFEIVFTTAYNHYAIKAIKYSAFDYLLKPIGIPDLVSTVYKLRKNRKKDKKQFEKKVELLFENLDTESFKRIALPTMEEIHFVKVRDIIRAEASGSYSKVVIENKGAVLVSKVLKDFEEMVTSSQFFRVHKSHLINLRHVSRLIKTDGGAVEMIDGTRVEIARRKREALLEVLLQGNTKVKVDA